jgi:hypothetical protein
VALVEIESLSSWISYELLAQLLHGQPGSLVNL